MTLSASLLSGYASISQNTTAVQSAETSSANASSAGDSSTDKTNKSTTESSVDGASYTIGMGQLTEHNSLDSCRRGFMADLEGEDIRGGVSLTVLYDSSQADGSTVSQIATNFIGKDVDLTCGIAVPITQTKYGVAKRSDIPTISTAITDPVTAELANTDGVPVGEVTGTSDKLPVGAQLKIIREILPEARNISIMYTTNEVNPESAIAEYKGLAPQYGFEVVDMGISSSIDITLATDTLMDKVGCITDLTDNTVAVSLPVILDKATAKNAPAFGGEIKRVKIGYLTAIELDYIGLGGQTRKIAIQVLRGEKRTSEISCETIKEATFYGDIQVARSLDITLPEDLAKNIAGLLAEIVQ